MVIKNIVEKYKVPLIIIFLIVILYILLFTSYAVYPFLPIVHFGERSWPLYFFILDGVTLTLTIIVLIKFKERVMKKKKDFLIWLLALLLLTIPLIIVWATYQDLNQSYCTNLTKDNVCTSYMPGPDLKAIRLDWNEK